MMPLSIGITLILLKHATIRYCICGFNAFSRLIVIIKFSALFLTRERSTLKEKRPVYCNSFSSLPPQIDLLAAGLY